MSQALPTAPSPSAMHRRESSGGITLPPIVEPARSSVPGLHFTLRLDGFWRPYDGDIPDHLALAALARHHLRERACAVLQRYTLDDTAAARDAVNTKIGRWTDPGIGIELRGIASLSLTRAERRAVRRWRRERDAVDLAHHQQLYEITRLRGILTDPQLRTVWLLDRHPDKPGLLDRFADPSVLTPARSLETSQEELRVAVTRFVDDLLEAVRTPEQKEVFLKVLLRALQEFGTPDLHARALRWQQSTLSPPAAEAAPGHAS